MLGLLDASDTIQCTTIPVLYMVKKKTKFYLAKMLITQRKGKSECSQKVMTCICIVAMLHEHCVPSCKSGSIDYLQRTDKTGMDRKEQMKGE